MAKETIIARLEKQCEANDQSIEVWSTRFSEASSKHKEAIGAFEKKAHGNRS